MSAVGRGSTGYSPAILTGGCCRSARRDDALSCERAIPGEKDLSMRQVCANFCASVQ